MTKLTRLVPISKVAIALTLAVFGVQASPARAGSLVLVGGEWAFPGSGGSEETYGVSIYQKIVDLAGGTADAKIGIISTASSNPPRSAGFYLEDFEILYGDSVDVEYIPITRDTCSDYKNDSSSSVVSQISDRNAFIFTGGDQSFITDCFFNEDAETQTRTDTALIESLRQQFDKGAVIAGTSAGTAVQPSEPMVTNGESYEGLRDGPVSLVGSPPFDNTLYYNPLGGLGFFEYGLLDSHFSERGRQGRIIRLASDLGVNKAYGVDENTALVVTDAGTDAVNFSVLGQGGVSIFDLSEANVGEKNSYWTIGGVTETYLNEGDQFNPLTNEPAFGNKTPITNEQSGEVPLERNIFSYFDDELGTWTDPRAFTETAIALFNSTETQAFGQSLESNPTYGVTLTKSPGAIGFSGTDSQGNVRYSFEDLEIAIAPVPEPGTLLGLFSIGVLGLGYRLPQKR
ncbi:Type 1 glutamine amidotransferase-like domain-containing protein [Leptolyngbya sp. FACHB-671]|uniref:Type 1 glutamine amidotransferase-like domain-containing protein n=1 Tax=Leptolyngbya sp. FACHB-671 TaxID=2692812 RepID=UPI0016848B4A|nr:Type 1 glutamine amidotransferase-like domain-containing protein [Leptolyngbya sp. FACHB-671]MBD2070539.1 Type 1 glutamine amidotransferase-like domain-containing protein [Leptolyngbya sp. FACHB-671]